ncbi:hypothetical protein IE53DRAFT_383584 [Violaceomyces palustris]|uniref:Uncharacterized protein n=1 Tax=Violaceomyces palustris TaxID=1673888 RepID=A0ACD0P7B1_9BASI|nr:hypothetical protein IE53DRAFT_383584 [Violaceomyces palustris]
MILNLFLLRRRLNPCHPLLLTSTTTTYYCHARHVKSTSGEEGVGKGGSREELDER